MKNIFFGKNLKILREEMGLKQSQMLDIIGFNQTTWNNYELGKSFPKFLDLIKISKFFDKNEYDLIHTDLQKVSFVQNLHEEKNSKKGKVRGKVGGKVYTQKSKHYVKYDVDVNKTNDNNILEEKLANYITFLEDRVRALEIDVTQLQQALNGFRTTKKKAG